MVEFFRQSEQDAVVEKILTWFHQTKRDLPWRRTYDPYHVWISEIMLQQTQMDRGVVYFLRWIARFSDVKTVAESDEQEILKYWQGLGYYARARNVHKAAKVLVADWEGVVPGDYKSLLTLPGIGPYTAAAIASVAANQDIVAVDANVNRLFARLFDIGEDVKSSTIQKMIHQVATQMLPVGKARQFNQALMDFGGLICRPKNPGCDNCPVSEFCVALKKRTVAHRPVVRKKKKTVVIHKVALIVRWNEKIFIQQRHSKDVWGGLWEFPGGECKRGAGQELSVMKAVHEDTGLSVSIDEFLTTVKHQYTNHKITVDCYLCTLQGDGLYPVLKSACDHRWVRFEELDQFGFPAGPRKILEFINASRPDFFIK